MPRQSCLCAWRPFYDPAILNDWAHVVDAARIARQISDPDYRGLVAESDGEIIGFAMAVLSKQELKALYTKPTPIGGIGHVLVSEIEKLAFQALPYLVCEASLNAEGFYKANGYAEEGLQDRVSRSGVISRIVWMKKVRPDNPASYVDSNVLRGTPSKMADDLSRWRPQVSSA